MREYPQGRKDIAAYADRLAATPGDAVQIMVSAEFEGSFDAELVRVVCGDARPSGTGFALRSVAGGCSGRYPARHQNTHSGSYGFISQLPEIQSLTLSFKIYPTTPERACVVLAGPGFALALERGRLVLTAQGQELLRSERLLRQRRWHEVALSLAAQGEARLQLRALGTGSGEPASAWSEQSRAPWPGHESKPAVPNGNWWLGRAEQSRAARFNGRLEGLRIFQGEQLADAAALFAALPVDHLNMPVASVVAAWDFAHSMQAQEIVDLTGRYTLQLRQHPTRAVRGSRWDGSEQDWRKAPQHYGAIHFHEDDLTDAGWDADFEWQLPEDLPSGVYAVQLQPRPSSGSATGSEPEQVPEYVPLFVRPGPNARRAPVALLMSTATYLAYGNQRLAALDGVVGSKPVRNPNDLYLLDHPQIGLSLYEHHQDGSGVHYASAHRPLLNMRPGSIMWSFNADTNLLAWLEAIDQAVDVITDHDLHNQGAAALAPYRAVITGTHPEYYSTAMLDGLTDWLGSGGRLMYMGGNGFYWRIAFDPEDDGVIEVRRAEDGTRAWIAEPGEYYHSFSGEYGGLWRRLGRPPNALVGVGFTAQGFDGGCPYYWQAAAQDPRAAFMTEGLATAGALGDFGTQGGGAAGEEIDRFDLHLGSPAHALVIASSKNHRPGMLLAKEEYKMMEPAQADARIRADLTFFETPSGGAVFSTGSISYAGALSVNGYNNPIAQLTGNVLRRFVDPAQFQYPA